MGIPLSARAKVNALMVCGCDGLGTGVCLPASGYHPQASPSQPWGAASCAHTGLASIQAGNDVKIQMICRIVEVAHKCYSCSLSPCWTYWIMRNETAHPLAHLLEHSQLLLVLGVALRVLIICIVTCCSACCDSSCDPCNLGSGVPRHVWLQFLQRPIGANALLRPPGT